MIATDSHPVLGVCAVVVTYFPEPMVLDNLTALAAQVERIVIVDNGSTSHQLDMLRERSSHLRLELIENGSNLGIAQALNRGVKEAQDARWVILFDQDSRVTPGFVTAMCACAESSEKAGSAALFVPKYYDLRFNHRLPPVLAPDGTLAVAMTSGSMMKPSLFDRTGAFVDWFVYEIDYEFSMRLRSLGHTIHECEKATLLHSPASPEPVYLFGKRLFYTRNYKPNTRYYMQRNSQWLKRLYGQRFPEYFRNKRWIDCKEVAVVILAERDKLEKLKAMLRGYWDGNRLSIPRP
jgi:rhamnosyltransferase